MNIRDAITENLVGRKEHKWVPRLYASYAICLIGWLFLVPADDVLSMHVVIFMTLVYVAALAGLCSRALQRIEERLDQL